MTSALFNSNVLRTVLKLSVSSRLPSKLVNCETVAHVQQLSALPSLAHAGEDRSRRAGRISRASDEMPVIRAAKRAPVLMEQSTPVFQRGRHT